MGIGSLSRRQQEIFSRIQDLIKTGEPLPSTSALGREFNMSQQAMSKNLKALEAAGVIRRDPHRYRSIELVGPTPKTVAVPLLGRIAAGTPIEPLEAEQYISVPGEHLPEGEIYALEIQGDSMVEDGIFDGDTVIVRHQGHAFNSQKVVAVINGEATLKRYYHEGDRIRLQPANQSFQPIYVLPEDDFEIRGVVHALFRRY